MGSMSIFHWLIVIVVLFLYLFPAVRIVQKAGYSGWWCLLLVIPIVNVIMFWVFALARWPNLKEA
jgi:hypothetical protein